MHTHIQEEDVPIQRCIVLVFSVFASRTVSSQATNKVAAFFLSPVCFTQHSSYSECPHSLLRSIFNLVSTLQQEIYSSKPYLKWMSQSLLFLFLLTGNKSDRKLRRTKASSFHSPKTISATVCRVCAKLLHRIK